jgi:hypothetical protein
LWSHAPGCVAFSCRWSELNHSAFRALSFDCTVFFFDFPVHSYGHDFSATNKRAGAWDDDYERDGFCMCNKKAMISTDGIAGFGYAWD